MLNSIRKPSPQVSRLADVLDEDTLEQGLATAAHAASPQAFTARVGPALRNTPEGTAAEKGLREGVAAVQARARVVLAGKIRRVLKEPLSDVCKRIIDVRACVRACLRIAWVPACCSIAMLTLCPDARTNPK